LWFHELFEILLKGKYERIEDYPLYKELIQFSSKAGDVKPETDKKPDKKNAADEENKDSKGNLKNKNAEAKNWKKDYDNLTQVEKLDMLVDEIFALYLFRTSRKTNEMFYKTILAYVIFFRECLNKIGW
jgi:sorbitol-specific phosphotransferase system component IIBC